MRNKKGFTLIELLVTVVLMLSILGIAIISFINISDRKKEETWEMVKEQTEVAAEEYYKINEYYLESLTTKGGYARVSIGKLVEEDFLTKTVNPINGKSLNNCDYVEVTKNNSGYLYKYVENKGNSACNVGNYTITSEPGAPSISVTLTKPSTGKNNYYINDVEVKATVSTGGNGPIKEVKHCSTALDSNNCENYETLTVKPGKENDYYGTNYSIGNNLNGVDGNNVTTIFAATNVSGKTISGEVTYKKDTENPVCGTNNGTTNWVKDSRTITQKCTDKTSGCTKDNYDVSFTNTIRVGTVKIEDKAGNTNDCSANVYVDADKPTCGNATGQGSTSNWTNRTRNIKQACSDGNGSGCEKNSFDKSFTEQMTTGSITIKDNVGHTRECTVGVYIDKTKPSCSISLSGTKGKKVSGLQWYKSNVNVSATFNDDLSGVDTKGLATSKNSTNNKTSGTQSSQSAEVTWYGYVKDKAGNSNDCSKKFALEKSVSLSFDTATTNNAKATSSGAKGGKVFNTSYNGVSSYGNGSGNCTRKQGGKYVGCAVDDGSDKYYFGRSCMDIGDFIRSFTSNSLSGANSLQWGGNGTNTSGINHSSISKKQYPTSEFNNTYKEDKLNSNGGRINFTKHVFSYTSPAGNTSNKVILYTEYSVDCGY